MQAYHENGSVVLDVSDRPANTRFILNMNEARRVRDELSQAMLDLACAQALSKSDEPVPITQLSRGSEPMIALDRLAAIELGLLVVDSLGERCENPTRLTARTLAVMQNGSRVWSYREAKILARRCRAPMWVIDIAGKVVAVNLNFDGSK